MSYRKIICLSAVATLGLAVIASDALAARGGARGGAVGVRAGGGAYRGAAVGVRGGAYRGGAVAYRGGAYRGGYYGRPGWGAAAVGAGVVGAAAASSYYNYGQRCGYYPYPACY